MIIYNEIGFKETQINLSNCTCKIMKTLIFFIINFNNNENEFLSLANCCRNVAVLDKLILLEDISLVLKNMVFPTESNH